VIPESFKQDLLNRVDIVDVVNARVPLKKAGANWSACCPFHTEKTPSFTVSPSKQFYHCFGCGAHGNAIGFLMEYAGLGYIDALRELAEGVGMKLPEMERRTSERAKDEGPDLYEMLAAAAKFYREQLKGSPRAIDYLKGRGLSGKTAARFGIGYAPDDWQGLQHTFADYSQKALVDCGLVIVNDQGRRYDRFRDRVMFPILNQRGFVIGFGGRVIGDGEPKYLNSPETPLFEKGRELYGLPQARIAIREKGRAIVVEGYMDVVMLAEHGVANAVATLGTATTPHHVQKLLRLTDEIVFCFDGDAAGRRAAWHALEVSLEALTDRKTVRFLFLPEGHDPDSFVREHGQEAFEERLADAQPLSAYLLSHLKSVNDLSTLEGRARLLAEAKPLVKRVSAPALQLQLTKALADLAGMSQGEVARLSDLPAPPAPVRATHAAPNPRVRPSAQGLLERTVLRCLLSCPERAGQIDPALFDAATAEGRALVALIDWLHHDAGVASSALIIEQFQASEHGRVIAEAQAALLDEGTAAEDAAIVLEDALERLRDRFRRAETARLRTLIDSGAASDAQKLEYAKLSSYRPGLKVAADPPSNLL
jgi:DNA primase